MGWGEMPRRSAQLVADAERRRAADELARTARRALDVRSPNAFDELARALSSYEALR